MTFEEQLALTRKNLSANIIRLRKERGLAQERLGLESGVDRTVVSKIERQLANPSLDVLVRLAYTLKVDISELLLTYQQGELV